MAGAGATASISTTIGVAAATLVVMAGILAGPTLLDCSADSRGFGSCLRDRMANSGLFSPEAEQLDKPVLSSEAPELPEISASEAPIVVVEPPKPAGWIEAKAGQFAGDAPAAVALSAPPGAIEAAGQASVPVQTGQAALVAPAGTLSAAAEVPPLAPTDLTLAPKTGALNAAGGLGAAPSLEATAAPRRNAEITVTGAVGGDATTASAELSAPLPVPEPEPVPLPEPEPPAFETPLVEISTEPPPPPAPEPPRPVRFDPAFPNVLVLPAPANGEDSSFRSLQLN